MPRYATYFGLAALLLVLSPARFGRLKDSIWMDEAWVANSLLEPSLHDVLFTKTWTQSSPPLFLLAERWTIGILGSSEAALRTLPTMSGCVGLVLAGLALRRWLSGPAALLALTLLCSNYYVAKYGQQVKQYGTDFLVSALLFVLVGHYIKNGSIRNLVILLGTAIAGMFLSYTAVFWLPTVLISVLIPENSTTYERSGLSRFRWLPMTGAGCGIGTSLLVLYSVFVLPNRTAALVRNFESSYLDLQHPLATLHLLISTLGNLLIPGPQLISEVIGTTAAALGVYAAVRSIREAWRGDQRCLMVALSGALPLVCVCLAGTLHLYPVLDFPRMLIFALLSTALLLGEGTDLLLMPLFRNQAHANALRVAVAGTCVLVVVASQVIFFRYPRPAEENRPAMAFIKSRIGPSDLLFVHGGMYEQFKYYRTAIGFHPEYTYIGNKQWPCCATGDRNDATNRSAKDFRTDLLGAAFRAKGHTLWLLFPAGLADHWSVAFRRDIKTVPTILAEGGCKQDIRSLFGQTLVESYSCL